MPRVGGEALDVAALALGVERVKGQRGFAGARRTGDDDQLLLGDFDSDLLEVVLPRAGDDDAVELNRDPLPRARGARDAANHPFHRGCARPSGVGRERALAARG
jgi:hypothetical protein